MNINKKKLEPFAKKYIWWKNQKEACEYPQKVIAQVMNIGDFDDIQNLTKLVGKKVLQETLQKAEVGQFSPKSWAYWHNQLGMGDFKTTPKMPERFVPNYTTTN